MKKLFLILLALVSLQAFAQTTGKRIYVKAPGNGAGSGMINLKDRNYENDSIAVVDGRLHLWDYYRTGNTVKMVAALPYYPELNYVVDNSDGLSDSTEFYIRFSSVTSFSVDWGDGSTNNYTTSQSVVVPSHKYASNGTYNPRLNINPNDLPKVQTFWLNNYPCATKVTKVNNLNMLENLIDLKLSVARALDSTTYDFAYPSTLTKLGLDKTGITKFHPSHTLPAGLIYLAVNQNNLTIAEVNNTLIYLDAQTFNAGTKILYISSQAPYNSPPSGAGLTAKASLESKGWVITTDYSYFNLW